MGACQLAFVRASLGDFGMARRIVTLSEQDVILASPQVAVRFAPVQARVLGFDGRVDEALAVLDELARWMARSGVPPTVLSSICHPTVARVEVLVDAGRLTEALSVMTSQDESVGGVAMSRLLTIRAEILARLGRWSEAVVAGRDAEAVQVRFDVDADHYMNLGFPDGYDHDDGRLQARLADLYAREIRLRDVLAHDLRGHLAAVQLAVQRAAESAGDSAGRPMRWLGSACWWPRWTA